MIGATLSNRYEIIGEIGRGGMGVVYRARDPLLQREVAIKLIPPAMLSAEAERRFLSEAQLVAQMDHPAIVQIFDLGHHENSVFFVMPVIEGDSLRRVLSKGELLLGEVLNLGIQVAEALAYSHSRGVLHRDIKPDNVMIGRDEGMEGIRARLMDFGLAQDTTVTRMTKSGMILGTMAYASPEQVQARPVDGRSDVYSLGAVLYECLSNQPLFSGEVQAVLYRIVHEHPQCLREIGVDVDPELDELVLSCLSKVPAERPSAEKLAAGLDEIMSRVHADEMGRSLVTNRSGASIRRTQLPFIGRESQMKEMQQRFNRALSGECQIVLLAGEPGSGKTRLLDELEALATARQIAVLRGRFQERDRSFPYHGFCEIIQVFFRKRESASTTGEMPDFSELFDDLVSLFPMLSEIPAFQKSSSGEIAQDGRQQGPEDRTQIFELLAKTLIKLAGGQPLVLFFESLHDADASIAALQYIVRRLGPLPVLIVGTYRNTEIERNSPLMRLRDGLSGDRRFSLLELAPFNQFEHRQYLSSLMGGSEVHGTLAEKLYEGSEGNPFFAKELVRSLLESDKIQRDQTGEWSLSAGMDISSDELPATIQQAVEQRVEGLPDEERQLLAVASVIGRAFEFDHLEALLDDVDDVEKTVENLVRAGLLEEDRRSRGDKLAFSSGILREVLYAELSRRKRRALHRKYAAILEKRNAGRLERVTAKLLHHYSEGDVPDKSVEFGLKQAEQSLEAFSPEETVRACKTALEFLDDEWEGDPALGGEARLLLANGYRLLSDSDAALRELDAAIAVFQEIGQKERLVATLLQAANAAWQHRQTEAAMRYIDIGCREARAIEATEALREFLSLAGTISNLRGDYQRANQFFGEAELIESEGAVDALHEEIPEGGHLVVAVGNPALTVDPAEISYTIENEILANLYEPLLASDGSGNLKPLLCEAWESRAGGRVFLFKLRQGVSYHDGTAMTAYTVKEGFEQSCRIRSEKLPAGFSAIAGVFEFLEEGSEDITGLVAEDEFLLGITLREEIPIYPVFLTDGVTSVAHRSGDGITGTGPFLLESREEQRILMRANENYWRGRKSHIERLEFRTALGSKEIAVGLRNGEFDLGKDLAIGDISEFQEDPEFGQSVFLADLKHTFYALFNCVSGPSARSAALRRALLGITRARDLVWENMGSHAQPAVCFIPPGLIGSDPGFRPPHLSLKQARALLTEANVETPLTLRLAVLPLGYELNRGLLDALFASWAELGIEVEIVTDTVAALNRAVNSNDDIDVLIGGWTVDFDDTDAFTTSLFNGKTGFWRGYFSSPETDELLKKARAESKPALREQYYRRFDRYFADHAVMIPLFHNMAVYVCGRRVRGAELMPSPQYLNYWSLGKSEVDESRATEREAPTGSLRIPLVNKVTSLDPTQTFDVDTAEAASNIVECLTRCTEGARIIPWLAESFDVSKDGKEYRFRLRPGILFHDGRRLTARDVRFSFERMSREAAGELKWSLSIIRGSAAYIRGTASEVEGIVIHSTLDFTIKLEESCPFFPALLSQISCGIVPEGTPGGGRGGWVTGTGPFRVRRFEPNVGAELEYNPHYWRPGYPKCRNLDFTFQTTLADALSGFKKGEYSLIDKVGRGEMQRLRRSRKLGSGYRETPVLGTNYIAFNTHSGAMSDRDARRRVAHALRLPETFGDDIPGFGSLANSLIPPGMLGHSSTATEYQLAELANSGETETMSSQLVVLKGAYSESFQRNRPELFEYLSSAFLSLGFKLTRVDLPTDDLLTMMQHESVDVVISGWYLDFPDSHSIISGLMHSRLGRVGQVCGSAKLDRIIEKAQVENDSNRRAALYREIEATIAREAYAIPLYYDAVYYFVHPDVEGCQLSVTPPIVAYESLKLRSD